MKCTKCNQELDAGAVFCGNCGQPVGQPPTMTPAAGPGAAVDPMMAPAPAIPTPVVPAPVQPVAAPVTEGGWKAITALVLGILGLIGWLIPIVGLTMGVMAVVCGSMTIKSNKKGYAITGLVLGSVVILLSLFAFGLNLSEGLKETSMDVTPVQMTYIANPEIVDGSLKALK